ncbi:S-layer homology domain-containing protein [Alkaliphilus pronyensis]|uniref:S-layer homology domain-containing protein n=1 Tax=Alkaliphilus pronyensis TaxID=1482732 RepID=A0A6I0FG58_9FIRM|nr:S-layer homology domain-containing protein [Alkaliphilus pronyensis]KAB3537368.1 S-layer homology domain-containing protein [Alkaliphilus pronyensis]
MKRIIAISIILNILLALVLGNIAYANTVSDYEQGRNDGSEMGKFLGEIYGMDDYSHGRSNDWERALPSDKFIKEYFNLSREASGYRTSFVQSFKSAFREAYKRGFRDSNLEIGEVDTDSSGVNDGILVGSLAGELAGRQDFLDNIISNWSKALPSEKAIINDYNLNREIDSYKNGFIEGFEKAFKTYYILGFRNANLEEILIGFEKSIDTDEYTNINIFGGTISTTDNIMTVEFQEGGLYRDNYIKVEKIDLAAIDPRQMLSPVTDSYLLAIKDDSIIPQKPFKLSFKYYGPDSGGIYQLIEDKWVYMPSLIVDDEIYTQIESSIYRGGRYAVLIKRGYTPLEDIELHWAEKEIDYFHRMDYVKGNDDNLFQPDSIMKRGEFIALLDNLYNWSLEEEVNLDSYKDSAILHEYKEAVEKALSNGYISGYSDKTLRAHMPISYQEVEWILQKVLENTDFKWKEIAEELVIEKNIYSKGLTNNKNFITKAEAVYLLFKLR